MITAEQSRALAVVVNPAELPNRAKMDALRDAVITLAEGRPITPKQRALINEFLDEQTRPVIEPLLTTAITAALVASVESVARQARVPAGNGHLSGRWIDMPGTIIDNLFAEVKTPSMGMERAKGLVDQVRDDPFNPENAVKLKSAATRLKLMGDGSTKENLAANALEDFARIDWYSDPDNPPETGEAPVVEAPVVEAPTVKTPKPLNSGTTDISFDAGDPEDPMIALEKTNPFWADTQDPDEKGNCQLSVLAWELRCRGYDVVAKLGHPQPPWDNGVFDWFEMSVAGSYERPKDPAPEVGRRNQIAKTPAGVRRAIDASIAEHPAGSRGFLGWYGGGKYSTAGHIVSWFKDTDGVTHLIDPQSGRPVTDDELSWLHTFQTTRLDDKDINNTASAAVTSGGREVYVPSNLR